jgi:hypothetical protein
VFGVSRASWRPDLPDGRHEPLISLLWVKVHELLGRVPEGSTARFVEDGTLPSEVQRPHRLSDGRLRASIPTIDRKATPPRPRARRQSFLPAT